MLKHQFLFSSILTQTEPAAIALIHGNADNTSLTGNVLFYQTPLNGVLVSAEIQGLDATNATGFFGMHIHEFGNCTLPFDQTGNHYNPTNQQHPLHAGDLPPLLSNNGYAWSSFFDSRFTIADIIGKSVVIHDMRDDFTSQPSGGSGTKIGCGVIKNNLKMPRA